MSSKPMTITLTNEMQRMLPPGVRRKAGFKASDERPAGSESHRRHCHSYQQTGFAEEDEYTPEQRRAIDAQLDEAEKGPFHGPFNSADKMIAHMKGNLKKRAASKSK